MVCLNRNSKYIQGNSIIHTIDINTFENETIIDSIHELIMSCFLERACPLASLASHLSTLTSPLGAACS